MATTAPDRVGRHRRSRDDYSSTPRRIRGLDGLRALAVAAVVVYHLGTGVLGGGFLGVDVFFVISGFLITTLLLSERSRTGRIAFGRFYARRARRLLPALLVMLAGTALLVATVARDAIDGFRADALAALTYVSNWWYIADEQSYFDLIGRGNPLAHLWSLAVEEQFYLVWPAVVAAVAGVAVVRRASIRVAILATAATLAVLSTAWMAVLSIQRGFPLDADPTRVYFGTDTHAMSVLIGAALAALWRPGRAQARPAPGARVSLGVLGAGLVAMLAWVMVNVHEYSPAMYRGGFLLVALLVAALIAVATHPASPLGFALEWRPLRWVGERSYGIYLWHWPVFLVTRPGIDLPWRGWWVETMRIGLTLAVAAASYRWVEEPIRRGALGRWWASARESRFAGMGRPARRWAIGIAAYALVIGVSFTVAVPRPADAALGSVTAISAEPAAPEAAAASSPTEATDAPLATRDIAIYGDSVELWAAEALTAAMPGSTVDATINRSPGHLMDAVLEDRAAGTLRPVVIMHMGTAGPIKEAVLRDGLDAMADRRRVVLVDSTATFPYVGPNNALMRDIAEEYPNVVFADWANYSDGHDDWLEDGLHLTEVGKPAFAELLSALALTGEQPPAEPTGP